MTNSPTYRKVLPVAGGTTISNADVAVTDDGRAFVIDTACTNPSTCTDYYVIIPPDATPADSVVQETAKYSLTPRKIRGSYAATRNWYW